jgi:hypothetical protein
MSKVLRLVVVALAAQIGCSSYGREAPTFSQPDATIAGQVDAALAGDGPQALVDAGTNSTCSPLPLGAFGTAAGTAFGFGRHLPQGTSAVAYAYSPEGTWKQMKPAEYKYNYYAQYATTAHPFDKGALIAYANGKRFTTAPDANGHLLFDADHNGELDGADGGFAFHEHNGRGENGSLRELPFTQFWFDDNYLARFMSTAYARPLPNGLSEYSDFTRWQILGGNPKGWTPYGTSEFDTLALDGMYALASGRTDVAVQKWDAIRGLSVLFYESDTQRIVYRFRENYHLALFGILSWRLADLTVGIDPALRLQIVQHAISIRAEILARQELDGAGNALAWRSDVTQAALINTETIALAVLALGAGADTVLEPGVAPMGMAASFFLRPYHVVSAVVGQSKRGFLTQGPGFFASKRRHSVELYLRAPAPVDHIALIEVVDASSGRVLGTRDVLAADMGGSNQWARIELGFESPDPCNRIEFRTLWTELGNLDIGPIRVH